MRVFAKRRRVVDHRRIEGYSGATEIRVVSADGRAVPLEVDGDWIGDVTEAVYGVTPGGLTVVS